MTAALAIGLDLGGTKIAAVLADASGGVVDREVVDTPASGEAALEALADAAVAVQQRLPSGARLVGIGAGIAGFGDWTTGRFFYGPNVPFRNVDIGPTLAERTGVPAWIDNDANVAALAEHDLGAGDRCGDMVMVTLGTGIGGGIISAGEVFHGAHGFAGEIGHMTVDVAGPRCACGARGHWEALASGKALDRMARDAALEVRGSAILEAAGGDPAAVTGRHVTAAAAAGDARALEVMADYADWVAIGLTNLVQIFDPVVIVIGGGVIDAGPVLLDPLQRRMAAHLTGGEFRPVVPVLAARLGAAAGAIGGVLLAFRKASA